MKRGYAYRIIAITLAFMILGVAILLPLGTNLKETWVLWIAGGILLAGYIACLIYSLLGYARKHGKKEDN